MKKLALVLMALLMAMNGCLAEDVTVFVSVSNGAGEVVLAHAEVVVTDCDEDGVLTMNDALMCAHAQNHEDGAHGYAAENSEYGMSLLKLWGEDNGGSYGYYLNNASAWSLLDVVKTGDHVKAYAYTDLVMWSDTYCYFEKDVVEAVAGEEISLTLLAAGYDAAWNPVMLPVANAMILVNGEESTFVTDENGFVTLNLSAGEYVISAVSTEQTLVPPVCIATVK